MTSPPLTLFITQTQGIRKANGKKSKNISGEQELQKFCAHFLAEIHSRRGKAADDDTTMVSIVHEKIYTG